MKRIYSLMALCLATSSVAFGSPIHADKAKSLAEKFFGSSQRNKALSIAYRGKAKLNAPKQLSADDLYYVINRGNGNGYVIVSGDTRTLPILAYADQGIITPEAIAENPSLQYMLDEYANQLEWAKANVPDVASDAYKALANEGYQPARADIIVEPLLDYKNDRRTKRQHTIGWNQDWPFNLYSPYVTYNTRQGRRSLKTVSGCVATGIATVMRWHEWPKKATGKVSYKFNNKTMSLDFDGYGRKENAAYDWSQMPEAVTSKGEDATTGVRLNNVQADNIGRLLRDIGYAVKMEFGAAAAGGSGSMVYYAPEKLIRNFGYKKTLTTIFHNDIKDQNAWIAEIKDEMQKYGPVVYVGFVHGGGGHCFVLDGLAKDNYVHVNWGWSNSEDGWYLLNVLKPGMEGIGGAGGGYSSNQHMLRYFEPDRTRTTEVTEDLGPIYIHTEMPFKKIQRGYEEILVTVGNKLLKTSMGSSSSWQRKRVKANTRKLLSATIVCL